MLERVALLHGGQPVVILVVGDFIVGGLMVHLQESVEDHHLAVGHEVNVAVVHVDGGRGLLYLCISHLRGDGALPYQVVEPSLL